MSSITANIRHNGDDLLTELILYSAIGYFPARYTAVKQFSGPYEITPSDSREIDTGHLSELFAAHNIQRIPMTSLNETIQIVDAWLEDGLIDETHARQVIEKTKEQLNTLHPVIFHLHSAKENNPDSETFPPFISAFEDSLRLLTSVLLFAKDKTSNDPEMRGMILSRIREYGENYAKEHPSFTPSPSGNWYKLQ